MLRNQLYLRAYRCFTSDVSGEASRAAISAECCALGKGQAFLSQKVVGIGIAA